MCVQLTVTGLELGVVIIGSSVKSRGAVNSSKRNKNIIEIIFRGKLAQLDQLAFSTFSPQHSKS